VARERAVAFAPGRVNLIGEHTDYNDGLALAFAIEQGVTVVAESLSRESAHDELVVASALDLAERDEFALGTPPVTSGWRAFVRGTVAELLAAGIALGGARVQIRGDVPRGGGLSSSAALEVALCLALLALARDEAPADELRTVEQRADEQRAASAPAPAPAAWRLPLSRIDVARLCARVEREWVGAHTGLLDQLASLCGRRDTALRIDFATLAVEPVPLRLDGWRLVVVDSGERHAHASSGYNERRAQCARACELLRVRSLREADVDRVESLPEPLRARARHVLTENERVRDAVAALRAGELAALGELLNASHASLRDDYEVSTPAVERAVARLRDAGAAGARIVGGGFGGGVLGLFAPGDTPPADALAVAPGPGARVLAP
jgi:galactokinase